MKNLDFEWLTDEFMLYCYISRCKRKGRISPPLISKVE